MKKIGIKEYNSMITEKAIEINVYHKFCMNETDGIVFESGDFGNEPSVSTNIEHTNVEPWNRSGVVHSTWALANVLTVHRLDFLKFMLSKTYKNFGFARSCTECLGLNVYTGPRSNLCVRPTPRMGVEQVPHTGYNRAEFDVTFMPLIHKMVNRLSQSAVRFQVASDRVYDRFVMDCHSVDLDLVSNHNLLDRDNVRKVMRLSKGKNSKHTIIPMRNQLRRASGLSILTARNNLVSGFCNMPHLDHGDKMMSDLQTAARKIIEDVEKSITNATKKLQQDVQRSERSAAVEDILSLKRQISHIKKIVGPDIDPSTFTTCGYSLSLENCSVKTAHAYFLLDDIECAIEIPTNCGCYHTFGGMLGSHHTAVPVTSDGKFVYTNDDDMFVLAWGAGKAQKRIYLEANGVVFERGERFNQRHMEDFFVQHADDQERAFIVENGWI